MKKIILLLSSLMTLSLWAAPSFQEAQTAYATGDYAAALQQYQALLTETKGELLYTAQLRTIASQYMLGKYMAAAQSAFTFTLPKDALWQARLLLYRIKTAQRVQNIYRAALPQEDEETTDFTQLSPAQWQDKIDESFEQLWALRHSLLQASIEQETLILEVENTDQKAIPTLFDFVVLQWKEKLENMQPGVSLRAEESLNLDYHSSITGKSGIEKLQAILGQAAQLEGKNRSDARLIWEADRLTLPFDQPRFFIFQDKEKARQTAIRLLQTLAGYQQPTEKSLFKKITRWFTTVRTDSTDYGKSYAAYKAALLLNEDQSYAQAAALCDWSNRQLSDNYYNQTCTQLADEIRRPVLQPEPIPFSQDPTQTEIAFSARNISHIFLRVYKITEKDLYTWHQEKKPTSWQYLTNIPYNKIPLLLSDYQPLLKQTEAIRYDKPHAFTKNKIRLPDLPSKGLYAVALSYDEQFDTQKSPVQVLILNNTDIALFVASAIEDDPARYHTLQNKTYTPPVFRIYTVDLRTGQPLPDTSLTYITDWKGTREQGFTDSEGILTLNRKIQTSGNHNSYFILPKATRLDSTAFLTNPIYFSFHHPEPVKLYVESDRAIYRPGQKVLLAVYGLQEEGRGLKTLPKNTSVSLLIRDTNGQKVLDKKLSLNEYGSAKLTFTLPQDGLLGEYQVQVSHKYASRTAHTYYSFSVEEYKRPDYEITLSPAAALQYDKTAHVTGNAHYYAGTALDKAQVQYTITRRYFHPYFWWWRTAPISNQTEVIANGKTTTDKHGDFTLSFTPRAAQDTSWPSVFQVTVSVQDASGRSIETSATYKAGQHNLFFQPSFLKGFYDANTPSPLAQIQLTDVNGQPVSGKFTAEIIEVENVYPEISPTTQPKDSLENWYGKNKEIRTISTHTVTVEKTEPVLVNLPRLAEGIYKLKLSAKQADTVELIFLVVAEKSSLALPAIAISQEKTYYPGSVAKILVGAQALQGPKQIEIYTDGQFLARREKLPPGVTVYSLPIQSNWRGGLYLRWFGASRYQIYSGKTFIHIPHDDKELSLTMTVPEAVKPGQSINWMLRAKDAAGNWVNGQASVRVYDKSLDYYASIAPLLSLDKLYPQTALGTDISDSSFSTYTRQYTTAKGKESFVEPPQMPRLNLQEYFGHYYVRGLGVTRGVSSKMMLKAAAAPMMDMATNAKVQEAAVMEGSDAGAGAESVQDSPSPRTDFSETAYFNPMLPLKGGKGQFSFKIPESLTTWNIQAFALTPDIKIGTYQAQTITRKDLMLRLSLPRFWREQDQTTLVVQVSNTSKKKCTAEVTLDVLMDGKEAAHRFGFTTPHQTLNIAAGDTAAATWEISVPRGTGLAQITATVRTENDTDAESRTLPILPAVARVAESTTAAIEDGSQTIQLENLLTTDPTRQVSSVTLRVDPGLLLSVLNAMPQLLRPGYKDALSIVNRYAPLSVILSFYQTYPLLQEAVKKLPKRDTQLPAWDIQDPSRLMLLTQTPWLSIAQGKAAREQFFADLFDPQAVAQTRAATEKQLASYQTAAGGFSWLPDGEPSEFITARILAAYSQILRYGGTIPDSSAKQAIRWLTPRIEKNLQNGAASAATVAYALYAAYIYTAFPNNWPVIQKAPVQKWLDYADQHRKWMTPLGQTYAAAAYYRLGNREKAQAYLDLVLSRLQTNPVTGAYFAPEAQSWLWYNDTPATQTATLRTVLEIRPQAPQAADLVKWLLFNRKAQAWQDTTSTAEAIYALLDYMQRRGLLNTPADYTLKWGNTTENLRLEPFDFTEPLSWTKTTADITPADYTAQVFKHGGVTGFVSLDAVYTTAQAQASQNGILNLKRRYLLKYIENDREKVRTIQAGEKIPAGSEIEVELTLQTDSAFDFVLLADPKPSGFENTDLISGWTWNTLSMYREVRDGVTHFFINRVPAGTYTLRYSLRPTLPGRYHVLPAQVQSMYAPQFSAHTAATMLEVK